MLVYSSSWSQSLAHRSHVEGYSNWVVNSLSYSDPGHLSSVLIGPDRILETFLFLALLGPRGCRMPPFVLSSQLLNFSAVCSSFRFCRYEAARSGIQDTIWFSSLEFTKKGGKLQCPISKYPQAYTLEWSIQDGCWQRGAKEEGMEKMSHFPLRFYSLCNKVTKHPGYTPRGLLLA